MRNAMAKATVTALIFACGAATAQPCGTWKPINGYDGTDSFVQNAQYAVSFVPPSLGSQVLILALGTANALPNGDPAPSGTTPNLVAYMPSGEWMALPSGRTLGSTWSTFATKGDEVFIIGSDWSNDFCKYNFATGQRTDLPGFVLPPGFTSWLGPTQSLTFGQKSDFLGENLYVVAQGSTSDDNGPGPIPPDLYRWNSASGWSPVLEALDETGHVTPNFQIAEIKAVDPDGTGPQAPGIVIAGDFSFLRVIGGPTVAAKNIALLTETTNGDPTVQPLGAGLSFECGPATYRGGVNGVTQNGSKIIASGIFDRSDTASVLHLATYDFQDSDPSWEQFGAPQFAPQQDVAVVNNLVFVVTGTNILDSEEVPECVAFPLRLRLEVLPLDGSSRTVIGSGVANWSQASVLLPFGPSPYNTPELIGLNSSGTAMNYEGGYARFVFGIGAILDVNNNGVFPEDEDVAALLISQAGGFVGPFSANGLDVNNNQVYPEDADITRWFEYLAGASCE